MYFHLKIFFKKLLEPNLTTTKIPKKMASILKVIYFFFLNDYYRGEF